jgi:hypothetical protein
MKRRMLYYALVIFILLLAGLTLFHILNPGQSVIQVTGFRAWLWEVRQLDLVVQVLLVFSGALGIAAILPVEGADD